MQRNRRKLALRSDTIRTLTDLTEVRGGMRISPGLSDLWCKTQADSCAESCGCAGTSTCTTGHD